MNQFLVRYVDQSISRRLEASDLMDKVFGFKSRDTATAACAGFVQALIIWIILVTIEFLIRPVCGWLGMGDRVIILLMNFVGIGIGIQAVIMGVFFRRWREFHAKNKLEQNQIR